MKHTISNFGPYQKHEIRNPDGSGIAFLPERGGNILQIWMKKGNEIIPVLDGHDSIESIEKRAWSKSDILIPFPNRIWQGAFEYSGNAYRLPINHHSTQSAIHGFCNQMGFSTSPVQENNLGWKIELDSNYLGDFDYFPFPFSTKMTYIFEEGNAFSMEIEVKNHGAKNLPIGIGWHPYLQLKTPIEKCLCQFPKVEHLEADQYLIPTGKKKSFNHFDTPKAIGSISLDDGFHILQEQGEASFQLIDPEYDLNLHVWQGAEFKFAQVFIPPARQSIAIEPMTCAANAFNNKMGWKELSPNESFKGKFGLTLE